ncbi:MAG: prepilin-type N-terminal cleavage/methylation domain-containing protein [Planctomycetaceae bacterium]|nr:prepilin-type N-terminal cleavage/methylation domain-containing protein [Planctomycetaceae bacterium]
MLIQRCHPPTAHRLHWRAARGFTLIELLVVVLITLVLTAITVSVINISINGDKVRSGARQIQSYLEGARDRAIFAKEPRGVRFLLDPTDPRTVSSLVYIAPTDPWTEGTVLLERPDGDNDGNPANNGDTGDSLNIAPYNDSADAVWVLRGFDGDTNTYTRDTGWKGLYDRGVLRDGARIQIPYGTGAWYTIDTRLFSSFDPTDGDPPLRLLLQQEYREPADTPATSVQAFDRASPSLKYRLELLPAPMPNQEPIQLPKGVVVHLDRCSNDPDGVGGLTRDPNLRGNRLPSTWRRSITPANAWSPSFEYTPYCDILFSPRGSVTGFEASSGLIHLYVADQKDADRDRIDWSIRRDPMDAAPWTAPEMVPGLTASDAAEAYQRSDKVIVSLFTRTGAITTNPIYVNADGTDNIPERFRYSETGEVAGR